MSGGFRHLFRHSVVYGLGGVAQRFIGFLLIPLYTRYLTPADYGVLALAGLLGTVFQQLQLLGIPSAMTRSYILKSEKKEEREEVVATGAWSVLVQALVMMILLFLLARPMARMIFGSVEEVRFVYLIAGMAPFYAVQSLRNTLFRIKEESKKYTAITVATFLVNLTLTLFLVVGAGLGAFGVLLGQAGASVFMALVFAPWMAGVLAVRSRFKSVCLADMMGYGLPLVPAGLASWALDLMDRYLLRLYRPLEEVGLYSLGYRFGTILVLLVMAFRLAWPQVMFAHARRGEREAKPFFARALTYYAVVVGFVALGIAVIGGDLLRLMTPEAFHPAAGVIPLIVLAYGVHGSFIILEVGIDVHKRTALIPLFTGLAAMVNLGLNLLLIPSFGMYGAAWATLVSFMIVPAAYEAVNRRIYPVRFQWTRIAMIVLMALVLFLLAHSLDTGHPLADLMLKGAILLGYPLALWMAPILSMEDRRRVSGWVRLALGRA
ncbi:MAG: oligosaccharide flippase family protein [Acidobacteriota bacterium]